MQLNGSYNFEGIQNLALSYKGDYMQLQGYIDVDWGGYADEYESISGYVFILNHGVTFWCSKKQTYVVLSIVENDFIVRSMVVEEGLLTRTVC